MDLNFTASFFIAFVPLLLAAVWYRHGSLPLKWAKVSEISNPLKMGPLKILIAFAFSFFLVYGHINLVIHQTGFYELFLTDILQGNAESKQIAENFLAEYGQKHRHFWHGVFHGVINAFAFALPFVGFYVFLENKGWRELVLHFSYWLLTSMLIGGLISEFV